MSPLKLTLRKVALAQIKAGNISANSLNDNWKKYLSIISSKRRHYIKYVTIEWTQYR